MSLLLEFLGLLLQLLPLNENKLHFFYALYSFILVPTASEESQAGAIVGGIFAVIVVILIAVAVVILYKRYPK